MKIHFSAPNFFVILRKSFRVAGEGMRVVMGMIVGRKMGGKKMDRGPSTQNVVVVTQPCFGQTDHNPHADCADDDAAASVAD